MQHPKIMTLFLSAKRSMHFPYPELQSSICSKTKGQELSTSVTPLPEGSELELYSRS